MDMPDLMNLQTCLIWYQRRYFPHSPERFIDASFLYVYLYSDDNDDNDGYDDDSDDVGDDDSDNAYDGLSNDLDS